MIALEDGRSLRLAKRRSRAACGCAGSGSFLLPGLERIGEGALAGRAFFHREDGAAVVALDDREIEPGAFLEQLKIALLILVRLERPIR